MVGAGIFIYPSLISTNLPHPSWFLLIWLIGGFVALTGALSSAELGSVYPEVGGDYAYLRNVYGIRWAFLYGFLAFFITFPGSIALGVSLSVHFQGATIFGPWIRETAFTLPLIGKIHYSQLIAALILFGMTLINHLGIRSSIRLQKVFTLLPLTFLVIIYLIALSIIAYKYFFLPIDDSLILYNNLQIPYKGPNLLQLGTALVPVYWTFTGWNSPLALGEEIKNPGKVIPLTMILGPTLVMLLYLSFAFVFIAVIPYQVLQAGKEDPFYMMGVYLLNHVSPGQAQFLSYLPFIISLLIFLLVLGNTNSAIISGSRVSVAIARDRLFWKKIGELDKKRNTPVFSIWTQSLFALIMILTVDKESNLLNFSFIAITVLSILTIFSIFVIRLKKIQKEMLYKAFGYPFTPLFYIIVSGAILVLVVMKYIVEAKYSVVLSSLLSFVIGLSLFEFWKKFRKKE